MTGLYIHIPFCASKCPYCDFYSERYSKKLAEEYKNAVIRNLSHYNETYDTVYFGGGTPILLWEEIGGILSNVRLCENAEITVEANPCVTDEKRLERLLEGGVNRISFGVQSLNDNELLFLGRKHTAEQAVRVVNLAYKTGFRNISADLMLGLPNQDKSSIYNSVNALSQLPLTHISSYLLKIEEGTPFSEMNIDIPEDEAMSELYLYTCEELDKNGFKQYEISNFARDGFMCRHNLRYWRCEEYIGIGAAAHSFCNGVRFCTERSIEKFISADKQEVVITDDEAGGFDEFAMLKLRLSEGLKFSECEKFGVASETIINRCKKIPSDYIIVNEKSIRLTRNGFMLSNAVIGKILGY
ncbi:MAG: radical SAM family heme chaperone HemW [Ruminiclostridium sp.]|nr:radical SAM family heme chaperone HemW [Ruminiclostridium sp.]